MDSSITRRSLQRAQRDYERAMTAARAGRDKAVKDALLAGWTQRQVADATGLTHGRIAQIASGTR